jgi:hypothetical protein
VRSMTWLRRADLARGAFRAPGLEYCHVRWLVWRPLAFGKAGGCRSAKALRRRLSRGRWTAEPRGPLPSSADVVASAVGPGGNRCRSGLCSFSPGVVTRRAQRGPEGCERASTGSWRTLAFTGPEQPKRRAKWHAC